MATFVPTSSLIIGLDVPLTPGKIHVVEFANQAFVNSADGQRERRGADLNDEFLPRQWFVGGD